MAPTDDAVRRVETAMVAIRRRQSRRALASEAGEPPAGSALFGVLDLLEAAAGPVTPGEVAGPLVLDQPRASKLVADGVRRGYVRRHADQADGRRTLLTLTDEGAAVVEHVHRVRRERFAAAMATWSDAEGAEFARLLTAFVAGLDRTGVG